jgi:hypothetical protein
MPTRPLLAIVAVLLAASVARADPAATLKQQGLQAAKAKNWELARERFEQSYALDPRPLTLFNLAVAQEHTDRLVEARASYARFLDQPASRDSEPFRKLAQTALAALDQAIPTLRVHTTGLAPGDVVELDGSALAGDRPTPLDPGNHAIVVRRAGEPVAQRTVAVDRGARSDVELAVPVPPPVPPPRVEPPPAPVVQLTVERPAPPPPEHHGVVHSGWFWGAAAVVVLGAAGAGYYYLHVPNRDPTRGTLGPGVLPVP